MVGEMQAWTCTRPLAQAAVGMSAGSSAWSVDALGRVAVVMGGWSAEREVSLMSGAGVLEALTGAGVDAHAVDATPEIAATLTSGGFDRAFLILHGRGGEDGTVQAALDLAGIPYTGSGVLGSALSMDKWRAKRLCALEGVPTPEARRVDSLAAARVAYAEIGPSVVVKPVAEGSSIGVTLVDSADAIDEAVALAEPYGPMLVETRMRGREVTAAILANRCLPLVSMQAAEGFYDYDAKYLRDDTRYDCPVVLPAGVTETIEAHALRVFDALDCRGWARVDFMLDDEGEPQFIECNTAPGMTSHSLVPMAAQAAGLDFGALCVEILALARTSLEVPA